MHNEFTGVFERDWEWIIAYCPEIPGANGLGRTKEDAWASLAEAIALILEDRREDEPCDRCRRQSLVTLRSRTSSPTRSAVIWESLNQDPAKFRCRKADASRAAASPGIEGGISGTG